MSNSELRDTSSSFSSIVRQERGRGNRVVRSLEREPRRSELQSRSRSRGFTLNGDPIPDYSEKDREKAKLEEKAWSWVVFYYFILTITLVNFISSIVICRILRLNPTGLSSLEILPETSELIFWETAHLPKIVSKTGEIHGYEDEAMILSAEADSRIQLQAFGQRGPSLSVDKDSVNIANVHDMSLIDSQSGNVLFSTSDPEWKVADSVHTIQVEDLEVGKGGIVSHDNEDLMIRSDADLKISGSEGVFFGARKMDFVARDEITLKSIDGKVELDGGVSMDTVMLPHGGGGYKGEVGQYKLCICMPSGILFKVAVPDKTGDEAHFGCHSVDLSLFNPCKT